ncbi:MAG TPA: penicillin-binding protein 2 [Candidatus Saccharimonadales bacterium]
MFSSTTSRVRLLYAGLAIVGGVFMMRLFYLQVLNGDSYAVSALSEQQKKYEIPPERGRIYVREGDGEPVPLVLNQTLKTLYADPRYIEDAGATAQAVAKVIGGDVNEMRDLLRQSDRFYVVLAKKLNAAKAQAIEELKLKGIGLQDATYRTYPEEALAAQILGFVNDEGEGQYGIEQYLDDELKGQSGLLRAVTDVRGIPLTASDDTVLKDPVDGVDVVLTIDRSIQREVEQLLASGVKNARGKSGSVVVMDPGSGAILAMANYPSYDPAKFGEVEDARRFLNGVVSTPYEVGSVIKPFTMSTGLNEDKIQLGDTYFDPGFVQVEDRKIENAGLPTQGTRTMTEIIQKSVNTGAVHVLKQIGGGDINQDARNTLYSYFTDGFGFGQPTGVEQAAEASGNVISPSDPEGNNVRYANMTFGQGMSLTMLQVLAGYSALVNGGTYYQPYLVDSRVERISSETTVTGPKALRTGVISAETSQEIRKMMEKVIELGGGISAYRSNYLVGGKTGTSQKLAADGTYSEYLEVGSFLGYGAGDTPKYVVMVKVDEPGIGGYAGTAAAAPIFADISNFLIDYYRIAPVR